MQLGNLHTIKQSSTYREHMMCIPAADSLPVHQPGTNLACEASKTLAPIHVVTYAHASHAYVHIYYMVASEQQTCKKPLFSLTLCLHS